MQIVIIYGRKKCQILHYKMCDFFSIHISHDTRRGKGGHQNAHIGSHRWGGGGPEGVKFGSHDI